MCEQFVECGVGEFRVSDVSCAPCPINSYSLDALGVYVHPPIPGCGSPVLSCVALACAEAFSAIMVLLLVNSIVQWQL